jgi:hypothetical protein
MRDFSSLMNLPDRPAVYALYGGRTQTFTAYVGVAGKLRSRMVQHFLRRDSSVTTGVSAVSLDPDLVSALAWWEHETFTNRQVLEAAELVAFTQFEPTLRSRGGIRVQSQVLYDQESFRTEMTALFAAEPSGLINFPDLQDAFALIRSLQARVKELEQKLEHI